MTKCWERQRAHLDQPEAGAQPWRKIPSLGKVGRFWLVKNGDQKSWEIIVRLGHFELKIFYRKSDIFFKNDKVAGAGGGANGGQGAPLGAQNPQP